MIDDHSRLCVASGHGGVKATDVVRVLHKAAETWGYPASFLTDNGLIFTAQHRHGSPARSNRSCSPSGIAAKHARPYHPQTCGKVERFHQTLKKFLAAQEASRPRSNSSARSIASSPTTTRSAPTGASAATPRSVYGAREKADPTAAIVKIRRPAFASTRSTSPARSRFATGAGSTTSASATPMPAGGWPCSSTASTSRSSAWTDHRFDACPRPDQGLPATSLTRVLVYDVLTHRSPMSCDITSWGRQGSNL